MDFIWKKTVQWPFFAPLEEDIGTDVLIIGGGLAGLLCAWLPASINGDHIFRGGGRSSV